MNALLGHGFPLRMLSGLGIGCDDRAARPKPNRVQVLKIVYNNIGERSTWPTVAATRRQRIDRQWLKDCQNAAGRHWVRHKEEAPRPMCCVLATIVAEIGRDPLIAPS